MSRILIRISAADHAKLMRHLFPGDALEHAAVMAASAINHGDKRILLVREVFLAKDGVDHLVGPAGKLVLAAPFVTEKADYCAENGLVYLSVHNHAGTDQVSFSATDIRAHEQLYPTLLQITNQPVGGLVFAKAAVAGDIWSPAEPRVPLTSYVVASLARTELRGSPRRAAGVDSTRHRQVLFLGERGQALLRELKVGVIGAGGAGSIIVELLARLGVGNVVVVDPDRIEESNFSRVLGSRKRDYRPFFWSKPARKVDISKRAYINANPRGAIECIYDDFRRPSVVARFIDCDYLVLAADPPSVKLLFNQICFQYLIPGVAVGARVLVERNSGDVSQATSSVRLVGPGSACLWCNGFITPGMLAEEAAAPQQRNAQRYIDDRDVHAPSVVTLNAQAASHAMNLLLFGMTGIGQPPNHAFTVFDALDSSVKEMRATPSRLNCPNCMGRHSRGSSIPLTTIAR